MGTIVLTYKHSHQHRNSMADVEIRHLADKGRSLYTKCDISAGTILFEEKPLVSCQFLWNTLYKYKACDHCMRPLETAEENFQRLSNNPSCSLPYPECCRTDMTCHVTCPACNAAYCCAECRDIAYVQYHRTLCINEGVDADHPLFRLQEAWRNIHFPPETASVMLIARMIAIVKQATDKDAILSKFSYFCHNTVNEEEEIVHKLLGENFLSQVDMLRELLAEALYDEHVDKWFTPGGFRSLLALIGTNGQGIGTSPLSVWVHNCEELEREEQEKEKFDGFIDKIYENIENHSGCFINSEGSGLYSLQSAINHSCLPNVEITFPNNDFTLAVKALTDIKAGTEVCISYLDDCMLQRSRHSRIRMLRENYLFNCSCEKCESQIDDPDETSEEEDDDDDDDEMDE